MNFVNDFNQFAIATGLKYIQDGNYFHFTDKDTTIRLVLTTDCLAEEISPNDDHHGSEIFLYEDRWYRHNELIRKRICTHLGQFVSIFARKCEVRPITTIQASPFLNQYHSYGAARSKYRYGLYFKDKLVAVSTFSEPRPMKRIIRDVERSVNSYEWVRYASFPDYRIVGGMGKLLQYFVDEVHPDEVMSYSDKEWSEGNSYTKLGFHKMEDKEPEYFYVDTMTYERLSAKKIARDKAYKDLTINQQYVLIKNRGSAKYLKSYL